MTGWPCSHTSAARMKGSQDPSPQSAADSVSCQVSDSESGAEDWGLGTPLQIQRMCAFTLHIDICVYIYTIYIYIYLYVYVHICIHLHMPMLHNARSSLSVCTFWDASLPVQLVITPPTSPTPATTPLQFAAFHWRQLRCPVGAAPVGCGDQEFVWWHQPKTFKSHPHFENPLHAIIYSHQNACVKTNSHFGVSF